MSRPDLHDQMLRMLDGELSAGEVAALEAELEHSPEARESWRKLARLHSALEVRYQSEANIAKMPMVPIDLILSRQRRRMAKASLLAAAAVVVISALVFYFKSVQTTAPVARFQLGPDTAFQLTHTGDEKAPPGNVLAKGSRLLLARGTMESVFDSGVRCVIEGPCDLTVLADDRISVSEGIAWFEVPSQAVGFTVETPQLAVVDLGTEFGVVARSSGGHEVHVIKGSVGLSTSQADDRELVLRAGQARRADRRGGFDSIPVEASRFATALPEAVFIANHSFEVDRNTAPDGMFSDGERADYGGELTAWISQSGSPTEVHVGWRGTVESELHPHPVTTARKSQALSLISGASVLNLTDQAWSSLHPGDRLTLTVSLGLRGGSPELDWNEATFFGLTDGGFSPHGTPTTADTVVHSGLIADNPATGNQSGDGTFRDISLDYTVREADLRRPGNIGILLVGGSSQPGGESHHQSFFDNVRLRLAEKSRPSPGGR